MVVTEVVAAVFFLGDAKDKDACCCCDVSFLMSDTSKVALEVVVVVEVVVVILSCFNFGVSFFFGDKSALDCFFFCGVLLFLLSDTFICFVDSEDGGSIDVIDFL